MTPAIDHSDRDHAICSASGAEAWTICTGRPALCERVPGRTTKAAAEGTQGHELADKILKPLAFHWNKTGKDGWADSSMMDFTFKENYSSEMWANVVDGYSRLVWDNVLHYKPKKVFVEQKVFISEEEIIPGEPRSRLYGTADVFFAFRDPPGSDNIILSNWDYKNGKGKIYEADDLQFKYYAAAVAAQFPKIKFAAYWLNVYQPRAEHKDGIHRVQIVTPKELLKTKKFLIKKAKEALVQIGKPAEELTLVPSADGDGQCLFCDALAICPAFTAKIQDAAGMDFADDPDLLLPTADDFHQVSSNLLEFDKERFSKLLQIKPLVKKFFNMLEATGINYMLSGGEIPGWKVVETRGKRRFKKGETAEVARGLKKAGIADPFEKDLRGLGSIEAELRAIGAAKSVKEAKALIEPFVEKSPGGYQLAAADDPRPRALGNEKAFDAFDAISVEEQDAFED